MMLLMRFQTIKKDIHSPPVVCRQPMGIRRKGIRSTLPTYECQSEAYYSLLEYLCQVLIPFRPQIAYRYPDLAYFFVFVSVHKYINLCAETRANNGTQTLFTLNHKNRIQATRPKIQRSLNNSYAITLISSRASQSDILDCYLSVPGKDLILFNTYFKVSEKLNCDCREDRLCAKPINRSIAWAGHR